MGGINPTVNFATGHSSLFYTSTRWIKFLNYNQSLTLTLFFIIVAMTTKVA